MSKVFVIASALITLTLLSGCAEVKPWEKATLAKRNMQFTPDPLEASFREHKYFSKEGSSGGYGSGGTGCGCN